MLAGRCSKRVHELQEGAHRRIPREEGLGVVGKLGGHGRLPRDRDAHAAVR